MCAPTGRQAVTPARPFSEPHARLTDAAPHPLPFRPLRSSPPRITPRCCAPAPRSETSCQRRRQTGQPTAGWGWGSRRQASWSAAGHDRVLVFIHTASSVCSVCSHLTAAEVIALGAVRPIVGAAGRVGIEVCGCGLPPRLAGILLLLLLLLADRLPPDGAAAVDAAL